MRAGEAEAADEGTETTDATDAAPEDVADDEEIASELPTDGAVPDIDLDADIPVGDEN